MKVKIDELKNLLIKAAAKYVTQEEAEYFAHGQIATHLKKYPRTSPLKDAIGDLESWANNTQSKMEIQADKPGAFLINFNKLGPSLKIKYIHDELEKRAKANGIAMFGINNSHGFHILNLWTEALAKRDLISIVIFNGGPNGVIPFGGTKGIFGTNPIAYSIPTENKPVIVDMATSEIPFFEISNAKKKGLPLRANAAVDSNGEITTDVNKAIDDNWVSNLLPMGGGYKGYALVFLIEVLTGSLVRSFLSNEMHDDYINEEHGGLIIAIDVASFTDVNKFKKSVSEMCRVTREQKPAKGVDRITVPGDRSHEKEGALRKQNEVELEDSNYETLKQLAQ